MSLVATSTDLVFFGWKSIQHRLYIHKRGFYGFPNRSMFFPFALLTAASRIIIIIITFCLRYLLLPLCVFFVFVNAAFPSPPQILIHINWILNTRKKSRQINSIQPQCIIWILACVCVSVTSMMIKLPLCLAYTFNIHSSQNISESIAE